MATAPPTARKLLELIAQQADHSEFYRLLEWLAEKGLIQVTGEYPFEEIRLTPRTTTDLRR